MAERLLASTRRAVIDMATDIGLEHDLLISPTLFDRRTFEHWRAQERALVMDIQRSGFPDQSHLARLSTR